MHHKKLLKEILALLDKYTGEDYHCIVETFGVLFSGGCISLADDDMKTARRIFLQLGDQVFTQGFDLRMTSEMMSFLESIDMLDLIKAEIESFAGETVINGKYDVILQRKKDAKFSMHFISEDGSTHRTREFFSFDIPMERVSFHLFGTNNFLTLCL